jgi:hypothetical protein
LGRSRFGGEQQAEAEQGEEQLAYHKREAKKKVRGDVGELKG